MKYLICVTNRVGSSWLCSMLASTGIAGDPFEHFNLPEDRWKTFRKRYEEIRAIDPLGIKTSYAGLMRAISCIGESAFADTPCIFLQRRDRLAQAISNYRASLTGQWWRRAGDSIKSPQASLDHEAVLRWKQEYEHTNEQLWPEWFRGRNRPPLEVYYEDMCDDPVGTVNAICQFLGFGMPPQIETDRFLKQRDKLSARWKQAFGES